MAEIRRPPSNTYSLSPRLHHHHPLSSSLSSSSRQEDSLIYDNGETGSIPLDASPHKTATIGRMEMVQSILTSCAAAVRHNHKHNHKHNHNVAGIDTSDCPNCTFLRKVGARYLSKEMLSFTIAPPITERCKDEEKKVAVPVLTMRTKGSTALKLTSLNGIPLRRESNSSSFNFIGGTNSDGRRKSSLATTSAGVSLFHGDVISISIPSVNVPREEGNGTGQVYESHKMHFTVIQRNRRRVGSFVTPDDIKVDAALTGLRGQKTICRASTITLDPQSGCTGGSSAVLPTVPPNLNNDAGLDGRHQKQTGAIRVDGASSPKNKSNTPQSFVDIDKCCDGDTNITKNSEPISSIDTGVHHCSNGNTVVDLCSPIQQTGSQNYGVSDEESPLLSMEHFSENYRLGCSASSCLDNSVRHLSPSHSPLSPSEGCYPSHASDFGTSCWQLEKRDWSEGGGCSRANGTPLSDLTLGQVRSMRNDELENLEDQNGIGIDTTALEKAKLRSCLLDLILHRCENHSCDDGLVLRDGVDHSMPFLLQKTCLSLSLYENV